jgi:cytidylate kinase
LAGAGKGTLSHGLSRILDIPNLESSFILRALTWVYIDSKLEFNSFNTSKIFSQLEIGVENNSLSFSYNGNILTHKMLKNSEVDKMITKFSSDFDVRNQFYKKINFILNNFFKNTTILDGRGADTPYLRQAEADGFQIIRILLTVNNQVNAERYYQAYVQRSLNLDPNFKENDLHKETILADFKQTILERNKKDIQTIEKMGLGLVSEDTGIVDTSQMTAEEVLSTVLKFIDSKITKSF